MMKRMFILIILYSLFYTNKNEPQTLRATHAEKEIFNTVVVTWYFSKLAHDENFKKIQEIPYHYADLRLIFEEISYNENKKKLYSEFKRGK